MRLHPQTSLAHLTVDRSALLEWAAALPRSQAWLAATGPTALRETEYLTLAQVEAALGVREGAVGTDAATAVGVAEVGVVMEAMAVAVQVAVVTVMEEMVAP